jgi:hypothetical protein
MISNTFTIQTKDSISVVRQKLIGETETSSNKRTNLVYCASLRGRVTDNRFKLSRVYGGGSPITTISGIFREVPGGTDIHVIMNPDPGAIFIVLFFILISHDTVLELISKIMTELNSFRLDAMIIFELFINIIGLLMLTGIPILMSILGWESELKFYQTRLTRIFLETE